MKQTKVLLTLACAILLVAASVMGTLAYLTATSGTVTNTFTVGNVKFAGNGLDEADVDEYGNLLYKDAGKKELNDRVTDNTYKLIPGHTYTKDPTVHIAANSERCWLFVKVVNPIASIEAGTTIAAQMANNGWVAVGGDWPNVYAYSSSIPTSTSVQDVEVFASFTLKDDADVSGYANAAITVQAGIVQADGFTSFTDAWTANDNLFTPAE